MKCNKCGKEAAEYVSNKTLCCGVEQLYRCEICKHEQKEILFHSSGRYDFASFSQPDG